MNFREDWIFEVIIDIVNIGGTHLEGKLKEHLNFEILMLNSWNFKGADAKLERSEAKFFQLDKLCR